VSIDRHSIIPAVWMIIKNNQDQIFLLRRHNTGWLDGWWTVPAGHIEPMESPSAAAIRELHEETGVMTRLEELNEPLIYFYPADDQTHERVSLFFEVKSYTGTPRNAEANKADKGEWFNMDALPENIVPLLRRALIDLPTGMRYSERHYNMQNHRELLQ